MPERKSFERISIDGTISARAGDPIRLDWFVSELEVWLDSNELLFSGVLFDEDGAPIWKDFGEEEEQ